MLLGGKSEVRTILFMSAGGYVVIRFDEPTAARGRHGPSTLLLLVKMEEWFSFRVSCPRFAAIYGHGQRAHRKTHADHTGSF
jgi:hypothetical protein